MKLTHEFNGMERQTMFLSPLSFGQNEEEPLEYKILSNDNEIDAWLIASKIKLCQFFKDKKRIGNSRFSVKIKKTSSS